MRLRRMFYRAVIRHDAVLASNGCQSGHFIFGVPWEAYTSVQAAGLHSPWGSEVVHAALGQEAEG